MDMDDSILLRRWVSERDMDAFVVIAMRHAKMVYSVALRILGNPHDAEEVAQECFEALADTKTLPTENLSGWLYQIAANQAQTRIRSGQRHPNREALYLAALPLEPGISWDDVYRYIDETILELPDIHRDPLVAHFFEQETQEMIAQRFGLALSSVSHRIQQGIETVRRGLKKRGIPITVTAMGTWFDAQATAVSVPSARLAERIAHIGLSGVGGETDRSASPSAKWIVAGIAVVVLVSMMLFLRTRPPESPHASPRPPQPIPSAQAKAATPPSIVESTKTTSTQSILPSTSTAAEDPLASLWGLWSIDMKFEDRPAIQIGAVKISQEGSNIVVSASDKSLELNLAGPIRGLQLQMGLQLKMRAQNTFSGQDTYQVALAGAYAPHCDSFKLSGVCNKDEQLIPLALVFTRLIGAATTAEQRKAEVQAIYSALEEYKKNFGGRYPDRLEEVARFFKGDVMLLTSSPGREITYQPKGLTKPAIFFSDDMLQPDGDVQYTEQIVAAEAHMHENGVYEYLFHPALLTIKYSNPAQRIAVSSLGRIIMEGDDTQFSEVEAAARCATCQNNLRQLGLVAVKFANDHNEFLPGGWAMTYPEPLTDPSVLSCPCRPIGDDSYELIFPAVSWRSFCMELNETIGKSIGVSLASNNVPMVVERSTHTVNGITGRNVMFFDGHVDFIALTDLAARVDHIVQAANRQ